MHFKYGYRIENDNGKVTGHVRGLIRSPEDRESLMINIFDDLKKSSLIEFTNRQYTIIVYDVKTDNNLVELTIDKSDDKLTLIRSFPLFIHPTPHKVESFRVKSSIMDWCNSEVRSTDTHSDIYTALLDYKNKVDSISSNMNSGSVGLNYQKNVIGVILEEQKEDILRFSSNLNKKTEVEKNIVVIKVEKLLESTKVNAIVTKIVVKISELNTLKSKLNSLSKYDRNLEFQLIEDK